MRISKTSKNEKGATARLHIVVPEEDKQQWIETAELLGISVSEYVRRSVRSSRIDYVIRQRIEIEAVSEIAYQLAKIGNNINQIAWHLNSGFDWSNALVVQLQDCHDEMEEEAKKLIKAVEEFNGNHQTPVQ